MLNLCHPLQNILPSIYNQIKGLKKKMFSYKEDHGLRILRLRKINLKWKLKTSCFKWKGENGKHKCSSQKDSTNSFLILYPGVCLMGIWQVCIYVPNWKKVHRKLHFRIQFCSYFNVDSLRNVFTWFL